MTLRKLQIVLLMIVCAGFALAAACSPADASEPAAERRAKFLNQDYNRVSDNPVRVRSAKVKETSTTTGYIGTERVRMRSSTKGKTTTTRGWVNGKYVTIKTKKD